MFTYLLTCSFGEYFLFYGLAKFYIYIALAWRHRYFLSKILFRFFTWSLGMRLAPICSRRHLSSKTDFLFPLFLLTEEGATSALGSWPIISLFSSFPWSQSANICWLSFCRRSVRTTISFPRVWLRSTDSLTHIFFLPSTAGRSWPTFFISLLTVNLWRPANSNTEGSRNSLFLFSQ